MSHSINKNAVVALALTLAATPLAALAQSDTDASTDKDQAQSAAQKNDDAAKQSASDSAASDDSADADASKSAESDSGDTADSDMFMAKQRAQDVLAGNMIGAYVNDDGGASLGSVENIVIDDSGNVSALVVGVGGFLGIGTKSVAVDFEKFEHKRADDGTLELTLATSKEQLQKAPTFKTQTQQKAEQQAKQRQQQAKQKMQQQQSGGTASGGSGGSTSGSGSAN